MRGRRGPHAAPHCMPQPLARIEISPNCSLTPSGAWWFFGTLCAACLLVASFFVVRGFWPVLPFAGLELGLVGWALHASMQRRHHRQTQDRLLQLPIDRFEGLRQHRRLPAGREPRHLGLSGGSR